MGINFSAFEIGRRALNANQFGIAITGQNIANVNTPGYSRKTVHLAEAAPNNFSPFSVGAGVTIQSVQAFRDSFIESRIQTETGIAGSLTARRDALFPVETALQGTETSGLQNAFDNFFGSFRDLEANPNSAPLRTVVAQKGAHLANSFKNTHTRLSEIRQGIDAQLRNTVEQVNDLSQNLADLNVRIRFAENVGGDSSSLRDQRSEVVNQISELTGARSTENDDGTITLTIGEGRSLVAGETVYQLGAVNTPPNGLASITVDGEPATFFSGAITGLEEAITETSAQIDSLNGLAEQVAARVNSLHSSGTDLDGNAGISFFDDSVPVTASNISVNALVTGNPRLVVASPLPQPGQNGTVAGEIASLLTDQTTVVGSRTGSFSSIFGSMIADAGEQVNSANNALQSQAAILSQAQAQRESVSGVSLDEEAINLLQYQKAYEAAARFLRVADEMTETILSLAQ
ncbi:MAG: flagellar hook-associated protein FlgK [Pyrinomonadaceae bacterium]|nr:flagellar hook-associated protein FlgK [Pyrinomonadaceae bacterium]